MKFPLQDGVFQEKDKLLVILKKILLVPLLVAGGAAIVYFLYLAANAMTSVPMAEAMQVAKSEAKRS